MSPRTAARAVPVYRLERVGAGRNVAVFVCSHLLGEEVEVVDSHDYHRLWAALRVAARQCAECDGRGGWPGSKIIGGLDPVICPKCEEMYTALGILQPILSAPEEVGHGG